MFVLYVCLLVIWLMYVCLFANEICLSVSDVLRSTDADITALAVKGGALWLGTRNGYLLILDSYLMEDDKYPLLGLQQCGQGKVKCIVPLTPLPTASSKLQVISTVPLFPPNSLRPLNISVITPPPPWIISAVPLLPPNSLRPLNISVITPPMDN